MISRENTRVVSIGGVKIGGGNPIRIQSMCNTKTQDVAGTVAQILALEKAGCEIIRVAVPDEEAARAIREIKKQIHIPLVADIHFDYRLAIASMENGADKIRINPGNIGSEDRVRRGERGEGPADPDPRGCEQRLLRKAAPGKVRRRYGGGNCGERAR